VYFTHSFIAKLNNPEEVLAKISYGGVKFPGAVRKGSVTGCQFHPEKSGEVGLKILKTFCEDR
jgi:glutamine amidotransferase